MEGKRCDLAVGERRFTQGLMYDAESSVTDSGRKGAVRNASGVRWTRRNREAALKRVYEASLQD